MGGGFFNPDAYRSYSSSVASKPVDHVYTSRGLDPSLDPKDVRVRESRDSPDNPRSRPIIVGLDVTGSMGFIADQIAKGGLGTLFQGILDRKPVANPHLMFMGIGDAACDRAPLQVSQFEADNRIVDQLTKIWLEKGGGSNNHESYDLPWIFAARRTVHDSMEKRGERGYLVTIGDEEPPEGLTREALSRVLDITPQADVPAKQSLEEAQRLYKVFHVIIEEGSHARHALDRVQTRWRALLGQHVISLADHKLLAETIVSTIQVSEGADHSTAAGGWGSLAASHIVGRAIAGLPVGVAPRRQLGA